MCFIIITFEVSFANIVDNIKSENIAVPNSYMPDNTAVAAWFYVFAERKVISS